MAKRFIKDNIKNRTVKIAILGPDFIYRKQLHQAFIYNGILDKEIEVIYKEKKAKEWFVVFATEEVTRKVVDMQDIKISETTCITLEKLTQQKLMLKIHWLPAFVSDEFLYEFFSQYGTVQHVKGVWSVDSRVYTGMREVYIQTDDESKHMIPHMVRFDNGINMLITCPGRLPVCLKCHRLGHVRQECPNGTIGRRVSSYADAIRSNTRAGTSGPSREGIQAVAPSREGAQAVASSRGEVQAVASSREEAQAMASSREEAQAVASSREEAQAVVPSRTVSDSPDVPRTEGEEETAPTVILSEGEMDVVLEDKVNEHTLVGEKPESQSLFDATLEGGLASEGDLTIMETETSRVDSRTRFDFFCKSISFCPSPWTS